MVPVSVIDENRPISLVNAIGHLLERFGVRFVDISIEATRVELIQHLDLFARTTIRGRDPTEGEDFQPRGHARRPIEEAVMIRVLFAEDGAIFLFRVPRTPWAKRSRV